MSIILQERFVDILEPSSRLGPGKVLKYNVSGTLACVFPDVGGIQPQIVVYVDTDNLASGDYIVSVTCSGGGITLTGVEQNGKWIFNVPGILTYTCTATSNNGVTASSSVEILTTKQYATNIVF